jgi:DNA (cytosine-5)-methyltransferase 1
VDTTKELPTVIAFCAGYGGIERGLDLAGVEHRVIAYVEIEAFAIANLVSKMEAGLLPPAPIYTDIKTFPSEIFRGKVSILTGGYPCQPFSSAGKRLGEDDPRHLWPHIRRHIEAIRPVQCFFENVEGHVSLGLSTVVSDLEEDGYRSAWGIFSAREVGAPHQRKRVYIMANSNNTRFGQSKQANETQSSKRLDSGSVSQRKNVAYTDSALGTGRGVPSGVHKEHADVDSGSNESRGLATFKWPTEPRVGRVVDGGSYRVDRLRMLGNGVVPQTAAKAYITLRERFA